MNCGKCENAKRNSRESVYCLLFGIMINRNHRGCKYHREGDLNENISGGHQPADQKA